MLKKGSNKSIIIDPQGDKVELTNNVLSLSKELGKSDPFIMVDCQKINNQSAKESR